MRKRALILMILFLSSCASRVPLLNWGTLWGDNPDYVTVIKGDTLYSLSKKYNVPLRDMIEANNLRPPYTLMVGQRLRMPLARTHIVAKGDTLYSISRRYNVDVTTLSRHNNIKPPYTLRIGQKLALPGSLGSGTSSHAAATPAKSSAKTTTTNKYKTTAKATPQPSQYRKTKFAWPIKGQIISPYGTIAKGRNNDGINIKTWAGASIKAADKGTVAYAGSELKGFGNLILIKHDDGWITAYAHNDRLFVKKGQRVARGEKIAAAGSTGGVSSTQLHFETRCGKKPVNPIAYLEK